MPKRQLLKQLYARLQTLENQYENCEPEYSDALNYEIMGVRSRINVLYREVKMGL